MQEGRGRQERRKQSEGWMEKGKVKEEERQEGRMEKGKEEMQ